MISKQIPAGALKLAELSGQSAETLWQNLKKVLKTEKMITDFNRAIDEAVAVEKSRSNDAPGRTIAMAALAHAGDVLFPNSPSSSVILVRLSLIAR